MAEYPDKTVESLKTKLDLAEKAYVLYPKNEFVLRHLARLGGHENKEIATEARRIYDPTSDKDAPALVLNELGAQAMGRKDYRQAIRYFELGRKKSPKSPEILNTYCQILHFPFPSRCNYRRRERFPSSSVFPLKALPSTVSFLHLSSRRFSQSQTWLEACRSGDSSPAQNRRV